MQAGDGVATLEAFKKDMALLESQAWISSRTRAIHVHFTLYNGNYDFWESNWYVLGLPASGIIHPMFSADIYRPTFTDFQQGRELAVADILRGVLIAYMMSFHFYMELGPEKSCSAFVQRVTRAGGFLDMVILGVYLYIVIVRYVVYGIATDTAVGLANELRVRFTNDQSWARTYDYISIAEAAVLACIVLRWIFYMRINRQTFIIWNAIWKSYKTYAFFLLVLTPTLCAFTVLGHTIWRADLGSHRTMWGSFTSTLMMLCGDYEAVRVYVNERPWTLIFLILFYIFMNLILVNAWVAAVVHGYQQVRVGFGYNPNDHSWTHERYANWMLWGPLARVYLRLVKIIQTRREQRREQRLAKKAAKTAAKEERE